MVNAIPEIGFPAFPDGVFTYSVIAEGTQPGFSSLSSGIVGQRPTKAPVDGIGVTARRIIPSGTRDEPTTQHDGLTIACSALMVERRFSGEASPSGCPVQAERRFV